MTTDFFDQFAPGPDSADEAVHISKLGYNSAQPPEIVTDYQPSIEYHRNLHDDWNRLPKGVKGTIIGLGVAAGLGVAFAVAHYAQTVTEKAPSNTGVLHPELNLLTLDNGAIARSDGIRKEDSGNGTSNALTRVDLGDGKYVDIQTPHGIHIIDSLDDANGRYYGVSVSDLEASPNLSESIKKAIASDPDGEVWFNEQSAQVATEEVVPND